MPHLPHNVNDIHAAEQAVSGFNNRLAVSLTRIVGTVWAAYAFTLLAIVGLLAILGVLSPLVALLVAWASQSFIQLVMLPLLAVGQSVIGRKQELQVDEQFSTTMKTYQDSEQIKQQLDAIDEKLQALAARLEGKG